MEQNQLMSVREVKKIVKAIQTSGKKYAYPDDKSKWNMRYFGTWKEAVKFTRSINKNNEYYMKIETEY